MAKLISHWKTKFPKTAMLFAEELHNVPDKHAQVWGAFTDITGLSDSEAHRVVMLGDKLPIIWFRDLGSLFAGKFEQANPRRIIVSSSIARHYEKLSTDDPSLEKANKYMLGKTMHEMVHWALFDQNKPEGNKEMGVEFERAAFDDILPLFWGAPSDVGALATGNTIALDHGSPEATGNQGELGADNLAVGLPRGIRNNNPGNIKRSRNSWQGLAARDEMTDFQRWETVFCVFREPVWGLRAMARILLNYQIKHGLRTVETIIDRWAPPSDNNDTLRYASFVASRMGVQPDTVFDFKDSNSAISMLKAMIRIENGMQPYNNQQIERAHHMALA